MVWCAMTILLATYFCCECSGANSRYVKILTLQVSPQKLLDFLKNYANSVKSVYTIKHHDSRYNIFTIQSHSVKTCFPLVVVILVVFILSTLSRKENNEIRMDTDLSLKGLYVMLCRLTWESWWWNLSIFGHHHCMTPENKT